MTAINNKQIPNLKRKDDFDNINPKKPKNDRKDNTQYTIDLTMNVGDGKDYKISNFKNEKLIYSSRFVNELYEYVTKPGVDNSCADERIQDQIKQHREGLNLIERLLDIKPFLLANDNIIKKKEESNLDTLEETNKNEEFCIEIDEIMLKLNPCINDK